MWNRFNALSIACSAMHFVDIKLSLYTSEKYVTENDSYMLLLHFYFVKLNIQYCFDLE